VIDQLLPQHRSMVPLMLALLLLEHLSRRLILQFLPIVRTGTQPGFFVNLLLSRVDNRGPGAIAMEPKQSSGKGVVIMEPIGEASPRLKARSAGIFYLLEMLTAGFSLFVLRRLGVSGDAGATAANILAHQSLFQLCWEAE
jgi:hypothetical protein